MQLNILNIEFAQGKFLDIFPSLHQGSQRSREDCEDGLLWIGKPRLQVLRCVAAGFMYSYAQESNISNVPKSKFQVSQSHTQYCNNIQQSKKSPQKKGHLSRKKYHKNPTAHSVSTSMKWPRIRFRLHPRYPSHWIRHWRYDWVGQRRNPSWKPWQQRLKVKRWD